jgi:FKBP-type peptidyl-prolyl cis-trans isomerase
MQKAHFPKVILSALIVFSLTTIACGQKSGGKVEFKTDVDKISYSIGVNIGNNLKQGKIEINTDLLKRALDDVLAGKTLALSDSQMMEAFQSLRAKQEESYKKEITENLVKASQFLADNAKKSGIVTLPDSIQYQIITEGKGPKPAETDTVIVNYTGTLIDKTVFDSSSARKEPTKFVIKDTIPGWVKVIPMMSKGSKWKVFIPPQLAYGERGPGNIPPNSLLIFEIELLDFKKGK